MTRMSIITVLIALSLSVATPVFAKGGMFGKQENIHKIQDVDLKGAEGERLYLGYKTSGYFFVAGLYLKDDGYVLGVEDKPNTYYPFPADEDLKPLQAAGLIPATLPEYTIPWVDYLFGYSLWIVLIGVAVYTWGKEKLFGPDEDEDASEVSEEEVAEDDAVDKSIR